MPRVFVHGVPETTAVWDPIRARIGGDSVALALPGFGTPRPAGFGATMGEYVDWILGQLEGLDGPIDLVGHDWGGILTSRIATTAGERLHSWVTDAIGVLDPKFAWHDAAKIWQKPGEGEEFWAGVRAAPVETAAAFVGLGVPEANALPMIEAIDETMSAAILDLYRSATNVGIEWQAQAPAASPGLVLVGGDDPLGNVDFSRFVADRVGAEVVALAGAGHWWLLQSPDAAAAALTEFWDRLG